jgi:hypothetical protein
MNLTPIGALISTEVSPARIANFIEHTGVFCEDRFGNVSFHHADSPMAQGILEDLELIVAADKAGELPAAALTDGEDAYWEIFHSGWPSDAVPDFKAHAVAMAKQLKVSRRNKGETGLLTMIEALLQFIEKGADLQTKHPDFENRAQLIDYLADAHLMTGLSRRNLQDKFAQAKLAWENALR